VIPAALHMHDYKRVIEGRERPDSSGRVRPDVSKRSGGGLIPASEREDIAIYERGDRKNETAEAIDKYIKANRNARLIETGGGSGRERPWWPLVVLYHCRRGPHRNAA